MSTHIISTSSTPLIPPAPLIPPDPDVLPVDLLEAAAWAFGVDVAAIRGAWAEADHLSVGPLVTALGEAIAAQGHLIADVSTTAGAPAPVPAECTVCDGTGTQVHHDTDPDLDVTCGVCAGIGLDVGAQAPTHTDLAAVSDAYALVRLHRDQEWHRQAGLMGSDFDPQEPRDREGRWHQAGRAEGLRTAAELLRPARHVTAVAGLLAELARARIRLEVTRRDVEESPGPSPREEWWHAQGVTDAFAETMTALERTGQVWERR